MLTQDLPDHPESRERGEDAHDVYSVKSGKVFKVNSHHHQGIYLKNLGEELSPYAVFNHSKKLAVSDYSYNLVEAMKHKTLPIAGVQWHPEEYYTEFADALLVSLMK